MASSWSDPSHSRIGSTSMRGNENAWQKYARTGMTDDFCNSNLSCRSVVNARTSAPLSARSRISFKTSSFMNRAPPPTYVGGSLLLRLPSREDAGHELQHIRRARFVVAVVLDQ